MAETAQPNLPKGYSTPVQIIQPYNASANRRLNNLTCIRFLYAFAIAVLVWFVGATFLRSVVHFVPWVS